MTDLEKSFLEKTKDTDFAPTPENLREIEEAEIDEIDKSALIAIAHLRSILKNEDKEPQALWRFVRYLTEVQMPLRFIDFTYMLFPGNEKYYANILTPTAFNVIQKQAAAMLENKNYEDDAHKEHLEKIVNGQMPYGYSLEFPAAKEIKDEEK